MFNDGQDNPTEAARKGADLAKQAGQQPASNSMSTALGGSGGAGGAGAATGAGGTGTGAGAAKAGAEAAAASTEAVANAAAATVQASVEGGKAIAGAAAGTAATAGWGAIIAIAWSMRHTLFRILICICLFIVFMAVVIVSLPSITFDYVFRNDSGSVNVGETTDLRANFYELAEIVSNSISEGYQYSLETVRNIIRRGGHDYNLSMQVLINHAYASADYDVPFILAAYSASMSQRGTTRADMQNKLQAVQSRMFSVTYVVRTSDMVIPGGRDQPDITVTYIEATIHPFNSAVIMEAFNINLDATYDQFGITYGEAIRHMANSLRMTLYGSFAAGDVPPITDAEMLAHLTALNTTPARALVVSTGMSLVGRVPYFWGGKSPPGWNDQWNTPRLVTSAGSSSTGTLRPFGLDCSGYTTWVFETAFGFFIGHGTTAQWHNSTPITGAQLLPGDLGFFHDATRVGAANHVLIYAGTINGNRMWLHSAGGVGVVMDSPTRIRYYRRITGFDLD